VKLWPVGTWPLKGAFYADLHKIGVRSGAPVDPPGYCHFATWLDEAYFKQITAERLVDEAFRGRTRKVWKPISSDRDNHFLDCRVYALALAEKLGLSALTHDEWAALAKARGMPPDDALALFKPRAAVEAAAASAPLTGGPVKVTNEASAEAAPSGDTLEAELERLGQQNAALFR
jgi:phage terminase large subunit GpA-like protein